MRRFAPVFLLFLSLAANASAASKHFVLRVHAQGNANDSSVFATPMVAPVSSRNIFIEKTASISERDVVAARVYPAADGTFGAIFQLDDHGRMLLETLSIENRGQTLLVFVNGRVLTELQIDRRVADGQLYLASGLSSVEIAALRREWTDLGAKKRR